MPLVRPIFRALVSPLGDPLRSDALPWEPGGGGSAPAWTPAQLTALRGWYRGDDVVLSGSDVTTFTDKSGNSNDLSDGGVASRRPAYSASGFNGGSQPYLTFDGAAEWLSHAAFDWGAAIGAYTVHLVMQDVTLTNADVVWRYSSAPTWQQLTGPDYRLISQGSTASTMLGAGLSTASALSMGWDGSTQYVYRNGALANSNAVATAMPASGLVLSLGANTVGAAFANVRIAEMVVQRAWSLADVAAFDAYASARYGV